MLCTITQVYYAKASLLFFLGRQRGQYIEVLCSCIISHWLFDETCDTMAALLFRNAYGFRACNLAHRYGPYSLSPLSHPSLLGLRCPQPANPNPSVPKLPCKPPEKGGMASHGHRERLSAKRKSFAVSLLPTNELVLHLRLRCAEGLQYVFESFCTRSTARCAEGPRI